jgi:hypothetical protein
MNKDAIKTDEDVLGCLSDKTKFEKEVLVATFKIPQGKVKISDEILF